MRGGEPGRSQVLPQLWLCAGSWERRARRPGAAQRAGRHRAGRSGRGAARPTDHRFRSHRGAACTCTCTCTCGGGPARCAGTAGGWARHLAGRAAGAAEADEDLPEPAWASREPLPVGSGSAGRWALVIAALVCVGAAALWFGRTTRLPAVAAGSAPASASLAPVPASPGAEASPVAVPVAASRAAWVRPIAPQHRMPRRHARPRPVDPQSRSPPRKQTRSRPPRRR